MSTNRSRPDRIWRIFQVALLLKGVDGVLELIGGVVLLVTSPAQLGAVVQFLTQHELSEDPDDLIANAIIHWSVSLNLSASLFAAAYLLLHGAVKVVLVWAVLRDRLCAYPWMIVFLLIFIVYQCTALVLSFSWGMLALTIFDLAVVALTAREYRIRRTTSTTR